MAPDKPDRSEKYLGESDWDDIDLLTTDEATERLDEDIETLRSVLAQRPDDDVARDRLDRLMEAKERLSQRRTFKFPTA